MHGIKRVITFCTLTIILPTILLIIPLYLRHSVFANVVFAVTESDVVEIKTGISPIFCSEHSLQMNESFSAYQLDKRPEKTSFRKHERLVKSMTLPDDTLEYWGFYLLKGSTVVVSVCSRFDGASILAIKGDRNLNFCGILDHNRNKALASGLYLPHAAQQVKVTYETNAQVINSEEYGKLEYLQDGRNESISLKNKKNKQNIKIEKKLIEDKNENKALDNSEFELLYNNAKEYLKKYKDDKFNIPASSSKTRHSKSKIDHMINELKSNVTREKQISPHKDLSEKLSHLKLLEKLLNMDYENENEEEKYNHAEENLDEVKVRSKRNQQAIKPELLDRGVKHGGNAVQNYSSDESEISSFENSLLLCFQGNVLVKTEFNSSTKCMNVSYLLNGKEHLQAKHEVAEDGYYYYIFYSDNDLVSNDIHVVFDIYKPTYQYENFTNSCINKTECKFPLSITTKERVIVEVPTRDGIEHDLDDITFLISICHPRMGIYAIFPISVLFLILGCAFM